MMTNLYRMLVATLGMLLSLAAYAADKCPRQDDKDMWDAACFESVGTERRVKVQYLARLPFEANGKAVIKIDEPYEMVAIDATGLVVVSDIEYWGEGDYPLNQEGVSRFNVRSKGPNGERIRKCGYFAIDDMAILVQAEYDHCLPFHEGEGMVCKDCERYCSPDDCHTTTLIDGTGFVIDRTGKVKDIFSPPTLKTVCDTREPPKIWKEGATPFLQCARSNNPFDHLD